jgi:hypothetical protein
MEDQNDMLKIQHFPATEENKRAGIEQGLHPVSEFTPGLEIHQFGSLEETIAFLYTVNDEMSFGFYLSEFAIAPIDGEFGIWWPEE